jgi:hypothetical protein
VWRESSVAEPMEDGDACELADVLWQPPLPYPSPPRRRRGGNSGGRLTQGGARSSLTLGYNQVIPTGFQFGGAEKVEGVVKGKAKG